MFSQNLEKIIITKMLCNDVRIYIPGHPTPINIDLSDHGNPNPGTPVSIWGKWEGLHQQWIFEEGKFSHRYEIRVLISLSTAIT